MYLLNHVKHKTIIESKHNALNAMFYLSQIKHCKTSAMLFMKTQNPNSAGCFLNHVTHKTNNVICFQSV